MCHGACRVQSALHEYVRHIEEGTFDDMDLTMTLRSVGLDPEVVHFRRLDELLCDLALGDHKGAVRYWESSETDLNFPGLNGVVGIILATQPTTAATERSFSFIGVRRDGLRNRTSFQLCINLLKVVTC